MKQDNKNIVCSVSSGYSSILMAIKLKEWYPDHNIINVMANTSKERKESLQFMNDCDRIYELKMIYVEAVIDDSFGTGTYYKIVDFENLKTNGEIFESGIAKYGIPSNFNKWCTRELKNIPLKKFADSLFGSNNYSIAIGIRSDEIDRISKSFRDNNIFYPLIEKNILSRDRNRFWNKQELQISIPAYKGNCDLCFKKSKRKILTIIQEDFDLVKWWSAMEKKYSSEVYRGKEIYNRYVEEDGGHYFNRGNIPLHNLIEESKESFVKATDEYFYENDLFDYEDDCGSGCLIFN